MFRNGQLCVYELMDEDSAVKYWEGYGKIAFDAGTSYLPLFLPSIYLFFLAFLPVLILALPRLGVY
jgi:hypothetical protein